VRANLASTLSEWNHSSVSEYIGEKTIDFINPTIILDLVSEDISSTLAEQQLAYHQSLLSWQKENANKKRE
jgi:hypothetical protein